MRLVRVLLAALPTRYACDSTYLAKRALPNSPVSFVSVDQI